MKVGYKTSEFWLALIPQILLILVVIGVVDTEQAESLTEGVGLIVGGVIMIAPTIMYIYGRYSLKAEHEKVIATTMILVDAESE
jgi:uncharacterized membrane protein